MATRSRRKTKGLPSRLIKVLLKLVVYFLLITLAWVGLMAFLPVPITATMIMDDNNITKDWEPLESISPNLTRAVIAAEDSKFCSHDGFDREAIRSAIKRNAQGGRIRGGSTNITADREKRLSLARRWLFSQRTGSLFYVLDRKNLGQETDYGGLSQRC